MDKERLIDMISNLKAQKYYYSEIERKAAIEIKEAIQIQIGLDGRIDRMEKELRQMRKTDGSLPPEMRDIWTSLKVLKDFIQ